MAVVAERSESNQKDPMRVAAGLKATLHNSRVSKAAKERALRRLDGIVAMSESASSDDDNTSSSSGSDIGSDKRGETEMVAQLSRADEAEDIAKALHQDLEKEGDAEGSCYHLLAERNTRNNLRRSIAIRPRTH